VYVLVRPREPAITRRSVLDAQEAMVPQPLTEMESRVLDYLFEYLRRNTYQPSIREIGSEFAIKSTKTVSELLQSLADKGWIERDPSRSRGVRLLGMEQAANTVTVPLLEDGVAAASAAELILDRSLVGSHGTFLVSMQGDHLVEQCIRPGDLLLVTPVAVGSLQTGDLVVARIGGRTTARRCLREGESLVLEPAEGEHHPTTLTSRQAAAVINGAVAGVVRRLRPAADHAASATAPPA
jgi:repressor LexA